MATQSQRVKKSLNTERNEFTGLQEEDRKIKTRNFKILLGAFTTALVVGGSAYFIAKEPSEWAPWVQTLTSVQAKKPDMIAKITDQKVKLEGLYSVNKQGIVNLQKYKEVAVVLKKAPEQLVTFYEQNERLYQTSKKELTSDQKILEGLFSIPTLEMTAQKDKNVEGDLKSAKKIYLSKESMQLLTSYQTTAPNRIAGMSQLSKNILDKTKELEADYNAIVAEVGSKLKSGAIDLNAGEKVFMEAAGQEINSTKAQIENAKKDLEESEYAELVKSNEAAYSQVASSVAADKKKVEELVKKYGANNVQVQPSSSGSGQTVVVHEQRGMGFMDYWLISQWMNTSSASSNYNSGYAAGAASNNSRAGAGIASSAYNTPTKVAPTTASIAKAQSAQKGYSNLYSFNNPDSPVAKKLAAAEAARNPGGSAKSSNVTTLSQKIAEKRNATVTRRAEAVKASARAAEARSAAARSNSNSSSSKSTSSGFGKSGGGMSGGG